MNQKAGCLSDKGTDTVKQVKEAQKKWDTQRKEDEKNAFEKRLESIGDKSRERSEQRKEKAEAAQGQPDKVKNLVVAGNNFDIRILGGNIWDLMHVMWG